MNTDDKLKIIQQLSGVTQVELARLLGVSFATVNSWINGKSAPRKSKSIAIDSLYAKYSGEIPEKISSLAAKKGIIVTKSKQYPDIISFIKGRPDVYDQLLLSFTYNTNSIEGSTLTENETASILFEGVTIKSKDLVEHLEAKNHQTALHFLFNEVGEGYQITESFILKLHGILMNSIRHDAGTYRSHGVRIVGSNVPTANHLSIPLKMKKLIESLNKTTEDNILHIAKIHADFEQIHPFSDGNGRVGRLLMAAMLLRNNLAPAIIKKGKKQQYYKCLQQAQLQSEPQSLEEFVCDAILNGDAILSSD